MLEPMEMEQWAGAGIHIYLKKKMKLNYFHSNIRQLNIKFSVKI